MKLEASRLNYSRGGLKIIDELSLMLKPGSRTALFGPNGAGKTSLLKLLAGLWQPDQGTISWLEQDDFSPRVGYIGHNISLYNDLSGRENLQFFCRLYFLDELTDDEMAEKIAAITARAGLELWLDEAVKNYSRGMQQKLAVCRCFLLKPDLLLLDEPFTGLDGQAADFLIEQLEARRNLPVLFTSHNIRLGYELADRWLILQKGRITASSEEQDKFASAENFIAYYNKLTAGESR